METVLNVHNLPSNVWVIFCTVDGDGPSAATGGKLSTSSLGSLAALVGLSSSSGPPSNTPLITQWSYVLNNWDQFAKKQNVVVVSIAVYTNLFIYAHRNASVSLVDPCLNLYLFCLRLSLLCVRAGFIIITLLSGTPECVAAHASLSVCAASRRCCIDLCRRYLLG